MDEFDKAQAKQIAISRIGGMSLRDIAKEMKLTYHKVQTISAGEYCQRLIKELSDETMREAQNRLKRYAADKLVPLIEETLRVNLEKHNVNVLPYSFRLLDLDKKEDGEKQDSQIVIQLPGSQQPPINITPKRGEETDEP